MANSSKFNKLLGVSPHIEMIVRRIYRNKTFHNFFSKKKVNKKSAIIEHKFDFENIINYLKNIGIREGDILIVHSAFSPLKASGLDPAGIIDSLLSLVGQSGTLVMPVIRKYPESPSENDALTADISNITFQYNVKESMVWTGIIPKTLMNRENAITSRIPINTLTALGPAAKEMFKDELLDVEPSPNGVHSAWNYCADKNAWVISLGTDLTHSLTMIHTAEDTKKDNWPVNHWYRKKRFRIVDGDFQVEKIVLERHPKWGMLHFGERTLAKDLIRNNIIKTDEIEGVLIESLRSKSLIDYLNNRNRNGYPYFWLGKYLKWK